MAIIGIGISETLLLGIGIGSVGIFLYQWNPTNMGACTNMAYPYHMQTNAVSTHTHTHTHARTHTHTHTYTHTHAHTHACTHTRMHTH